MLETFENKESGLLFRIRLTVSGFIVCLLASGVTAFPLLWETGLLVRWCGNGTSAGGLFPALAARREKIAIGTVMGVTLF